jgi:hypothetical protein
MILTKSLNWRSMQKRSSRSDRRRPIAIRSLKAPPKRSVSIEPSKVAVQSDSFVGRFVSWFACPASVDYEWIASRRLLYGRTKLGQLGVTCTDRGGYGLRPAHQRTALLRQMEFIPERSISGRGGARAKYA